eukprot:6964975-Pyramimonas_sp.AAC.1
MEGVAPEKLQDPRQCVCDQGLKVPGEPSWDAFEIGVALPCMPPAVAAPRGQQDYVLWGDWSKQARRRGNIGFSGGSGFVSAVPELMRCGWAFV